MLDARGRDIEATDVPAIRKQPMRDRQTMPELDPVTIARCSLDTNIPSLMIFCDFAISSR